MTELNTKNPILIDLPMPIETDRMIIREPRFGDGEILHQAKQESVEELIKWMEWAKYLGDIEDDEKVVRDAHVKFLQKTDLMMFAFDKVTKQFLGSTGIHRFDWEKRVFEIGYWYRTSATGQGYATESTKALIKYAFDVLQANKVIIIYSDGNCASRRVIGKCGFNFEYTVKQEDKLPNGEIVDKQYYSLFNADHLKDFNVKW